MSADDDRDRDDGPIAPFGNDETDLDRPSPGGPYFGRLLIVLFAAIVFCAVLTWVLAQVAAD